MRKCQLVYKVKHISITPNHHPSSQECTEQWTLTHEIADDQECHTKLFFKSSSKLKTFLENHIVTQFMTRKAALQEKFIGYYTQKIEKDILNN